MHAGTQCEMRIVCSPTVVVTSRLPINHRPFLRGPVVDQNPNVVPDVLNSEGRRAARRCGQPGVRGHNERAPAGIVPRLRQADVGKIHPIYRRLDEFPQIRLVVQAPERPRAAGLVHRHTGIVLPARIPLVQAETPGEFAACTVPGGLIVGLGVGFQLGVDGVFAELPCQRQTANGAGGLAFQGGVVYRCLLKRLETTPAQELRGPVKQ